MNLLSMLVRTHLLCPYNDCEAHLRSNPYRIQVIVDVNRNVILQKPQKIRGKKLDYKNEKWVRNGSCPYCTKPVEVVIDETHQGRNVNIRLPSLTSI